MAPAAVATLELRVEHGAERLVDERFICDADGALWREVKGRWRTRMEPVTEMDVRASTRQTRAAQTAGSRTEPPVSHDAVPDDVDEEGELWAHSARDGGDRDHEVAWSVDGHQIWREALGGGLAQRVDRHALLSEFDEAIALFLGTRR